MILKSTDVPFYFILSVNQAQVICGPHIWALEAEFCPRALVCPPLLYSVLVSQKLLRELEKMIWVKKKQESGPLLEQFKQEPSSIDQKMEGETRFVFQHNNNSILTAGKKVVSPWKGYTGIRSALVLYCL